MSLTPSSPHFSIAVSRPVAIQRGLRALASRMTPAVQATVAVAATGLAAEYALRGLANRALAMVATGRKPLLPSVAVGQRVVVTEWSVREQVRRVRA